MAASRRISLIAREIRERVSPAGFELLLRNASRISEGQAAGGRYDGCTMVTFDLEVARQAVRERCDVATAAHLGRLLEREPELLGRLRALALEEALRIASRPLRAPETEIRVRVESCRVFVDIDVEGELSSSVAAGRPAR
jgi:hypothetical protein